MKMATIQPSGVNLMVDDVSDLLKQSLDYFFIQLEICPKIKDKFYDSLSNLLEHARSIRIPIVKEIEKEKVLMGERDYDIEIEIMKCGAHYTFQAYYLEDYYDDVETIKGECMTVQTDGHELLTP